MAERRRCRFAGVAPPWPASQAWAPGGSLCLPIGRGSDAPRLTIEPRGASTDLFAAKLRCAFPGAKEQSFARPHASRCAAEAAHRIARHHGRLLADADETPTPAERGANPAAHPAAARPRPAERKEAAVETATTKGETSTKAGSANKAASNETRPPRKSSSCGKPRRATKAGTTHPRCAEASHSTSKARAATSETGGAAGHAAAEAAATEMPAARRSGRARCHHCYAEQNSRSNGQNSFMHGHPSCSVGSEERNR